MDTALRELEALVSPIGQGLLDRLARVEVAPETELRLGHQGPGVGISSPWPADGKSSRRFHNDQVG